MCELCFHLIGIHFLLTTNQHAVTTQANLSYSNHHEMCVCFPVLKRVLFPGCMPFAACCTVPVPSIVACTIRQPGLLTFCSPMLLSICHFERSGFCVKDLIIRSCSMGWSGKRSIVQAVFHHQMYIYICMYKCKKYGMPGQELH